MAWNGSSQSKNAGSRSRATHKASRPRRRGGARPLHWLALLAVLAALALAAYFALRGGLEEQDVRPPASRGKDAKPARTSVDSPVPSGRRSEGAALPEATGEQIAEQAAEEKKPGVFAPGMIRLPNGFELRFKLPAEGETRQLLAGGEIWEVDSEGNIENVTPPPVFEKPFEGMISSLYERDGMVLPFALKRYSDEEVRRMCREPTLSYDDDTPEITMKRENVAMLKRGILEFLDGGGTFEEFVDDMQQHSQKAQRAQVEGMHGVRDLLLAGRDSEAVQYYRLFSQDMADKGYGELKLPRSYRAALEEIASKEDSGK